ncbi:MAG: helix-turn-helix transcriptional regulator [Paludibacter sp.]|jgi:AraC-like DNA-binding protein/mannose-6-phosphate isomerase-like protein (cupin superfamily)|nr:helix-turn-helix transcriptional regulator [Paludibacter sp.]
MLHQEIKTYTLAEKTAFSSDFSIKRMEASYSLLNGRKPAPHRHDYYSIYYIVKGTGSHIVDFMEYEIEDGQLYFLMPGQMHKLEFSSEPQGFIVSFSEHFLISNAIPDYLINDIYLFNDYGQSPPLPIHESSAALYLNLFEQIETFSGSLEKYTLEAVGALVKLLLIQSNNHCSLKKEENPQFLETTNHLLRSFKQLLNKHYVEKHMVNDYAEMLAVTPDYLNKTVKSITGKSAKDHIQSKLITEAKRWLLFTNQSNKELAYSLGFEESAHFNNFFKKNTGMTPTEFKTTTLQS